jgi:hypothetical protein
MGSAAPLKVGSAAPSWQLPHSEDPIVGAGATPDRPLRKPASARDWCPCSWGSSSAGVSGPALSELARRAARMRLVANAMARCIPAGQVKSTRPGCGHPRHRSRGLTCAPRGSVEPRAAMPERCDSAAASVRKQQRCELDSGVARVLTVRECGSLACVSRSFVGDPWRAAWLPIGVPPTASAGRAGARRRLRDRASASTDNGTLARPLLVVARSVVSRELGRAVLDR